MEDETVVRKLYKYVLEEELSPETEALLLEQYSTMTLKWNENGKLILADID